MFTGCWEGGRGEGAVGEEGCGRQTPDAKRNSSLQQEEGEGAGDVLVAGYVGGRNWRKCLVTASNSCDGRERPAPNCGKRRSWHSRARFVSAV